jgi:hypothetical protein
MVTPTRIISASILLSATFLQRTTDAFTSSSLSPSLFHATLQSDHRQNQNQHCLQLQLHAHYTRDEPFLQAASKFLCTAVISAALMLSVPAFAEDELLAKYGGKGFDSSLVDQTCLVDKCSLQAKACLADDPSCRKGLTCTAKCLGDNACITGCMAQESGQFAQVHDRGQCMHQNCDSRWRCRQVWRRAQSSSANGQELCDEYDGGIVVQGGGVQSQLRLLCLSTKYLYCACIQQRLRRQ